ncbi:hypothetical protein THAR02_08818 [Trichoderma harzianum]|uniref:Transmembrane protein n=1 Tax=Trichoderma harzianum TaxID=5544 RepID=A0A0F9ZFH1_TRIHA|nr:hypothetical protein THAR02_08818 [Trichoderma harzianum]
MGYLRPNPPPPGPILPVAVGGTSQVGRAHEALSRLGSNVREIYERFIVDLRNGFQRLPAAVSGFFTDTLSILNDALNMIASFVKGVLDWLRAVDENSVGRLSELRSRLGILVGACLAMAAILTTLASWEHLHGSLFSVMVCLVGVCAIGVVVVSVIWIRAEGEAHWVAVLAFLTGAALIIATMALTSFGHSRVSNVVSSRDDGDLERGDSSSIAPSVRESAPNLVELRRVGPP